MNLARVYSDIAVLRANLSSGSLNPQQEVVTRGRLIRLLNVARRHEPNPVNRASLDAQYQAEVTRHGSFLDASIDNNKRGTNVRVGREIGLKFRRLVNSVRELDVSSNKAESALAIAGNVLSLGFSTLIKIPAMAATRIASRVLSPAAGWIATQAAYLPLALFSTFITGEKYNGREAHAFGNGVSRLITHALEGSRTAIGRI